VGVRDMSKDIVFKGTEIYCYWCGKYAIVDEETDIEKCIYCGASGNIIRKTNVKYSYEEISKE